jgi:transcriptional regulator with XRE-family HTH domain
MLETQPAPIGGLSIGATIRLLRESRGLASDELGRLIGKSGSLVRLIELGRKRATLHVCVEIARVLDVPVARLVGEQLAAIIADQPTAAP